MKFSAKSPEIPAFNQFRDNPEDFIAKTKGSMSSLEPREIGKVRIDCAKKFFARITTDQVNYDVVDSYGNLLNPISA